MKLVRNALVLTMLLPACVENDDADAPDVGQEGQEEKIPFSDSRAKLFPQGFTAKFSELIDFGQIGEFEGMPADKTPYPDTYWPMIDDGINVEWLSTDGNRCRVVLTDDPRAIAKHGKDVTPDDPLDGVHICDEGKATPSPLAKYLTAQHPNEPNLRAQAISWEKRNHGVERTTNASWFGHCPGWAGGTHIHDPITGPTFAKAQGDTFVGCEEGTEGCQRWEIGDINALTAEIYEGAQSRFLGARCDLTLEEIDEFRDQQTGAITKLPKGCKGVNFGASLIITANQWKIPAPEDRKPINIDAQQEHNTAEIWNQPAFGRTVHSAMVISESQAANAVAKGSAFSGARGRSLTDYSQINPEAKGWVLVDMAVHWVSETPGANTTPVSGLQTEQETRMVGIVELDRPASDPDAEVIGGELLDNPSVGASRLRNNPFMWTAQGPSPDPQFVSDNNRRNPFIRAQAVEDLNAIAQQQNSPDTRGGQRRGDARGNNPDNFEAVCNKALDDILTCLQSSGRVPCLSQIGGGTRLGGLDLLRDCGFIE